MSGSDRSDPGVAGPDRRSCHRCRQPGHLANDCPNRSTAVAAAPAPASGGHASLRSCYACGDLGHYARDCPRIHKPARKRSIMPGSSGGGSDGSSSGGGRPSPAPRVPEGSTPRGRGSRGGGRPSPTPRPTGGSRRGAHSNSIGRNPAGSTNHTKEKENQEERNNGGTKKGTPAGGGGQYPAKGTPAGGGGQSRWVRKEPGASSRASYQCSNRTNSNSSQPPKTPSCPYEQEKEDHSGPKDGFTGNRPIVDGAYENNSGSSRNNEKEKENGGTEMCTPTGGDGRSRWVRRDSSSSSSSGLSFDPLKVPTSTREKEKADRGSGSGTRGNHGSTKDGSTGDGPSDLHASICIGSVGNATGIYESNSSSGGSLKNSGGMGRTETSGVVMTGDVSFSSSDIDPDEVPVSLTAFSDFEEWLMSFNGGGCGKEEIWQNKEGTADGRLRDGNRNSGKSRSNNGVLGSGGPVVIEISSSSSSEDEDEQVLGKKSIGSFATTVRVKEERRKVVEEDDEDCVILNYNPFQPPTVDFEHKLSLSDHEPSGEDEDVCVISERGQVACRDYPHSRHHCAKYPFGKTLHESCCPQCYCYVCDVEAPCEYWSGRGSSGHCHASDCDETWKIIRSIHKEKQRIKSDSVPGSTVPVHPLYDTLPRQLWYD